MGILLSPILYFSSCVELSLIFLLNRVGLVNLLKWWLGYEFGTSLALFFPFELSKWDILFHGSILHKPMIWVRLADKWYFCKLTTAL